MVLIAIFGVLKIVARRNIKGYKTREAVVLLINLLFLAAAAVVVPYAIKTVPLQP